MNEGYSENEKVQRFRARKVEVKTSPKLDILADGITLGQGKVEIKSRQAAVTVIAPEPSTETLTKKDELAEVPAPVYPSKEKAVLEEISS
jgi:hypothetical protein